ncbi:MAG: hypothetical protein M3N26_12405 [Pseudomonadota bacterium]|nr:hypothetical protein [Pseudomonadota bacterium]
MHDHDRGVLLGVVFSIVPIPPVALTGLIISLFNLRLLARGALPPSERRLIHLSIIAATVSFVVGAALFAAIGWIVLHALSIKLPAVWSWIHDLTPGLSPQPGRSTPGYGVRSI